MSFHPVMLRLDRGILRIGSDRGITRSSRVMAEKEENVGDNGKEREDVRDNDREKKMSGNDDKKGKVGNDDKRNKPLKAVRETSRITEI